MSDDDATQEASDKAVQEVIEDAVDDHGDLVKNCLAALRMNGVPLNCATADALHELAARIHSVIHEALDTVDVH